ncbi:hypothetical protein ACLCDV_10865 [Sphingobacterium sp. Lzh-3]|uniref:hypothetical protein n=1 Tax=Sphingobacterium sp. Lzh-3 TaxID=3382150 RepID=UPI00398C9EC2
MNTQINASHLKIPSDNLEIYILSDGYFDIGSYITTKTFDRNFIFSDLNKLGNNWAIYSEKGLNWTLPYTIGTSYH